MSLQTEVYFGNNITELRTFHALDLNDVARKLHVEPNRYRHWEEGKAYPSKPYYFRSICAMYGYMDLYSLFFVSLNEESLQAYYNLPVANGWLLQHIKNINN